MADHVPAKTPPVGEHRRPGMDHAHGAFRTLTEAPRFTWPGDARIAFTVTLMLDYWEVNPPEGADRDPRIVSPLGNFFPDWLTWRQREYGARVAETLAGADRRIGSSQRLLPRARHICHAAHHQPDDRSRRTCVHR